MSDRIGVGIIGASPERGWAVDAHIPALRSLSEFELAAISTSRKESAKAAAEAFGVKLAFDNHRDLLARPEVDIAVVAVKVPHHLELASAAIEAGKPVYCEWPLGKNLAEAEQLAELARERGVFARVGLQARAAPVINHIRELLAQGYVGTVLSSSIVASANNWGADVLDCYAYLLDRRNGASMLSIPFGHTLDAFCWLLGEFAELNATWATRRPQVKRVEDGHMLASDVADQLVISGVLESGAVASVHFRGGLSRGTNFLWEINGTEGDLLIEGDCGHIQMMPLRMKGARGGLTRVVDLPLPASCRWAPVITPQGMPFNLAQAYLRLAEDFRGGSRAVPSFDDAVVRHRMIDAIERAAESGRRQRYDTRVPRESST